MRSTMNLHPTLRCAPRAAIRQSGGGGVPGTGDWGKCLNSEAFLVESPGGLSVS
jgi:hypothetical protein